MQIFINSSILYYSMKTKKSYTINEKLIKLIDEEAKNKQRSSSFIVNNILEKHFNVKRVQVNPGRTK